MHLTDVLGIIGEFLPRRVKVTLAALLIVGLMSGVATPLVMWFVQTKAHEMTSDLTPIIERMIPTPTEMP